MRFLAAAGVSLRTVEFLAQLGHHAEHIRALGMQRAPDLQTVDRARADGSVVITFDLDSGDVLALGVLDKPSVIILRLSDERATFVNGRLAWVLGERLPELEAGSLILRGLATVGVPDFENLNNVAAASQRRKRPPIDQPD